jgi:hypothetical protein
MAERRSDADDLGRLEEVGGHKIRMRIGAVEGAKTPLEQEEQPSGRLALLSDDVGDLDHRPGGDDPVEILAEGRKDLDGRNLRDHVEVLPLVEHQVDVVERLEATAEPALRLSHALRDRPQLASIRAQQDDDLVGLAERVGPKHDPLIVVESHSASVPLAPY